MKYFRFMMDQYFKSDPMDDLNKALLTHASYNAGPGRIRQLRREAARRSLDPNVWFDNVEEIVSARIGRETVSYVSNIYKYTSPIVWSSKKTSGGPLLIRGSTPEAKNREAVGCVPRQSSSASPWSDSD